MSSRNKVNWREALLSSCASIRDAIRCLNDNALQIVIIVDAQDAMIGSVTDGDIRRALIRGETLDASIRNIMCTDFRTLPEKASHDEALALMRKEALQQIPVLDNKGRVRDLFLLEELVKPAKVTNPVVIMAGGEGRRLRPLTKDCPKPMLHVGGKPMLEIILEQCIEAGFQEFYLSVNYLKDKIKEYFNNGARWNVNIEYLEEQQPLGTGGALSLLPRKFSEPLLVLNGDVLTRVDYGKLLKFHSEQQATATLCVREHSTQIPFGVVQMDDLDILTLEEKPVLNHHVNAGVYMLDPILLDLVPSGRFLDMPNLIESAINKRFRVCAFPIHEYWLDIGQPDTYERAYNEWYEVKN